jgi:hypothetical protein
MTVNGIKAENTELRQEVARLDEALALEVRRSVNLASEKADDRVQYSKLRDVCRAQEEAITRLTAEVEMLRAALKWYAEQAEGCRKLGSIGDPFRHALDADGGKRARAALSGDKP